MRFSEVLAIGFNFVCGIALILREQSKMIRRALGSFGFLALVIATPAHAKVLLDLQNAPPQSTQFNLSFVATGVSTTITISGYELLQSISHNQGLFLNGDGPNLLGQTWTHTRGLLEGAEQYNDRTGVNGIHFKFGKLGSFDEFAQTAATIVGDLYVLSLTYAKTDFGSPFEFDNTPSEFLVEASSGALLTTPVPEPSTCVMLLIGFAGIGFGAYRRRKQTAALAACRGQPGG